MIEQAQPQALAPRPVPPRGRGGGQPSDPGWLAPLPDLGARGWYLSAVLILASRPFYDLIVREPYWPAVTDGVSLAVLGLALLLILRGEGLRRLAWSLRALPSLWLVLALALASSAWSLLPQRTLHDAFWLGAISVVGVALGGLVSPRLLMRALFWALSALLLLSTALELAPWLLGADPLGRVPEAASGFARWRGVTWSANFLGPIAACAGLYFFVALVLGRLDPRLAATMLALAVVVTLMTRSATALVMLAVGLATVACLRLGRRLRLGADLTALLALIGLVGCASLALLYWEATTNLLGKDATASNRLAIWQDAIAIVGDRPLLGHGYGVVWGLGARTLLPEHRTTIFMAHAHNGYLQVAAQLGLPALVAAIVLLLHTLLRGLVAYGRWSSAFALFATGYVVMFAVGNLTEARLFERWLFDWDWLLFVILATALARAAAPLRTP